MSKGGHVVRGSEHSGVSGYAAKNAGIFILDFALDNSAAKGAGIRCRGNRAAPRGWRVIGGVCHPQWTEYFPLTEDLKRLVSDALKCNAQNDESKIAVFRPGAWIRGEWDGECGC